MNFDPKNTVFIIDGSGFLYRAYYGLRPLHTPQGKAVQAVFGFCRTIKKLIDIFGMEYVVIAWDSKGTTTRHTMYEAYKATRQAPPSDIFEQKEYIIQFAELVGIKQVSIPGVEADDIIYSIAKDAVAQNNKVVMVTADKDMGQALNQLIYQYDPLKNMLISAETFEKDQGFSVDKLPFYYGLLGDASDNIPGVQGIGKKGALDLVTQFSSLEDLYANLDKVKPRTKLLLEEQKQNALLSRDLFLLQYHNIGLAQKDYHLDPQQYKNAAPLFVELDFKSLLKEIDKGKDSEIKKTTAEAIAVKTLYWREQDLRLIMHQHELQTLCDKIRTHKKIAIDTETDGINPFWCQLVGVSIAYADTHAYYIPCGHTTAPLELSRHMVLEYLKPLLQDPSIEKYMHNAKYDIEVFLGNGVNVRGLTFDTMIAAKLTVPEWQKVSLKALSLHFLNEAMISYPEIISLSKAANFKEVPVDLATIYAGADALQTFKLHKLFSQELQTQKLATLYYDQEHPLIAVLCAMEQEGIAIDKELLAGIGQKVALEIADVEQQISLIAGILPGSVNFNSPRQVEQLLFTHLLLPPQKKSAKGTGYSTDYEVLTVLTKMHPVPGLILKHRELSKLKSTYIDALPGYISPVTGRIHTSFGQTIAATGRLASSDPNLQNVPVSGTGVAIRAAFKPRPGDLFIAADYSQIELRVLAYLAQDAKLLRAFANGDDIHKQTAAGLFEIDPQEVTQEQRQLGKRINFSILYGQTPFGLSRELGISFADAKLYIERYFKQYPGVQQWMSSVIAFAKEHGYVHTFWGRKRQIPNIYEKNKNLYEEACRVAINTIAQGTAADIVKQGMILLHEQLEQFNGKAKLILQIHDEVILTVAEELAEPVQALVKKVLEQVTPDWNVPLEVSLRSGDSWLAVTK